MPGKNTDDNSGGSTTQIMSLSLFIMLLAFFIILNAISTYETQKSKPIMRSIQETFTTRVFREDARPSVTKSPLQAIGEGDTLSRMKALFKARMPGVDPKIKRTKGTMSVTVAYDEFSDAVMTLGQQALEPGQTEAPPFGYFLPTMIDILQSTDRDKALKLDMILNTPASPINIAPDSVRASLYIENLDGLALRLGEAGLAKRFLNIGLKEGEEDTITLFFRPFKPYNPLQQAYEKRKEQGKGAASGDPARLLEGN